MIVSITDDFNLEKIVNSGQCFRPTEVRPGVYRFICGENVLYINQMDEVRYDVSGGRAQWDGVWANYFDFDKNYIKIRSQIPREDYFLQTCAKYAQGIRILSQDPFETLISFIISQRKSIPAIRSSVEKIAVLYGKKIKGLTEDVHLFPTATEILDQGFDKLNECSLGYRLPFITSVVEDIGSGKLNLDALKSMTDEDLLATLMEIKGVGIKVASCVALFAYGRCSMAPVDTWIKRCIEENYAGISPFDSYGENSGIYQQYMFYYMTGNR